MSTTTMQAQAQQTIADNVLLHTQMLIEALKQNYIEYSIRGHKRFVETGDNAHYHIARIQDLRKGECPIDYVIETGRKYHKVIFVGAGSSRSVHCFIDKNTGSVLKSASWKAPAKGERCNLLIIKEREWALKNADWSGGWLYRR